MVVSTFFFFFFSGVVTDDAEQYNTFFPAVEIVELEGSEWTVTFPESAEWSRRARWRACSDYSGGTQNGSTFWLNNFGCTSLAVPGRFRVL